MDVVWDAMLLVTGRIAMETNCKGDVKEKLEVCDFLGKGSSPRNIVVLLYICLDTAWSRVVGSWRTASQKDFCCLPLSVVNSLVVVPVGERN